MGQDQSAVAAQAGWPGIQTEYICGIRPFLDLGGRFEFDYSFGDVNGTTVVPVMVGVGAEYLLQPRMALVADVAAGPIFYNSGTDFGFHTMVGVAWKL